MDNNVAILEEIKAEYEHVKEDIEQKIQALNNAIETLRGDRGLVHNEVIRNEPTTFHPDVHIDSDKEVKKPRGGGIRKDI